MKEKIIIIGGGVSGITTALTLQLLGYETTIYAEHLVDAEAPADPRFASLYPAASIIPHSVQSTHLETLFPASLQIFEELHEQGVDSIELQHHYEIFEFPVDFPSYTHFLHRCSAIDEVKHGTIPRRANAPELHGWVFDCFVAKWPYYMDQLYSLYRQAGGTIKRRKIGLNDIPTLPSEIIINCTGIWSDEIFEDEASWQIIRGHLLHINDMKPVVDSTGKPDSYNYTPLPSIYATPDGSPSDVYFYPIANKWILGGSRQPGTYGENRNWKGRQHDDTITISGLDIPRQIMELNKDILRTSRQADIDEYTTTIDARLGYRFTRGDTQNGLRIEAEEFRSKQIIHNYGHGGAGVTLSWGCALRVLRLLNQINNSEITAHSTRTGLLNNLQLRLHRVYLNYF